MIGRRAILGLAAALAGPSMVRAQLPALPVIGFLHGQSSEQFGHVVAAFHEGLAASGYREGRDVAIEYRWAQGRYDRLPALAAELVRRQVAVIFTAGATAAAVAAKAATDTIPIIGIIGGDPIAHGLVASFSHPAGNLTGVTLQAAMLNHKRVEILQQLLPAVAAVAVLINPTDPSYPTAASRDWPQTADRLGLQLDLLPAATADDIEGAFTAMTERGVRALAVSSSGFFNRQRDQIVSLAARQRIPAIYESREFAAAGGLISYGPSLPAAYRQCGLYVGRVLDGETPADLPFVQANTFDFVVNLRTAAALGLTVPPEVLVRATEVIE